MAEHDTSRKKKMVKINGKAGQQIIISKENNKRLQQLKLDGGFRNVDEVLNHLLSKETKH